ncbi:hypothetical protein Bbelb_340820 [Branchiostoma belcheri]|nr:hypothetical protein Bbelb_340820 [Branchiostoma belcheri]
MNESNYKQLPNVAVVSLLCRPRGAAFPTFLPPKLGPSGTGRKSRLRLAEETVGSDQTTACGWDDVTWIRTSKRREVSRNVTPGRYTERRCVGMSHSLSS